MASFHDGITGTSIDAVNDIIVNDIIVAQKQFAGVLQAALEVWSAILDTQGQEYRLLFTIHWVLNERI